MIEYTNKITALYSRLSVGDEDRDGRERNSIVNQKAFLEWYARQNKKWDRWGKKSKKSRKKNHEYTMRHISKNTEQERSYKPQPKTKYQAIWKEFS